LFIHSAVAETQYVTWLLRLQIWLHQ